MKKIAGYFAIGVCLACLIVACGRKTDLAVRYEMEKKFNEADRLQEQFKIKGPRLSDDDLEALVEAYEQVTDMVDLPDDSVAVLKASRVLHQTWELALLSFTRIGALYLDRKEYESSYNNFKIIVDSPAANLIQRGAAINYLALCRENAKRYKEAARLYEQLADSYKRFIQPQNPNLDALSAPVKAAEMWLMLGNTRKYDSMLDQARTYYNQIRSLHPGTPFESAVLGKIVATYLRQQKYNRAVTILEDTRDDSTGLLTSRVLMILADIHMNRTGNYKKAEQTYREFIRHYTDTKEIGRMTLGLGVSLFEQQKYSKAREAIKGIKKLPKVSDITVAEAYYLTAICYEKEDRWEQAIGQFDLVQASFPGTDKAFEAGLHVANRYRSNGQIKLASQKFEETAAYITRFTNPETSNPLMAARAMGYLVRCYTETQDITKVIETLEQLFGLYPLTPEGRFAPLKLADIYENEIKDNNKVIKWLTKFIEINPDAGDLDKIKARIQRLKR
ncbi:MAG: tetratricopeptide repeat protein [candidate division Zixibacteria bacterium]|nr:tetratricopeptide repeat protein [candidate division Zixibacteria bacterium]